MNLWGIIKGLLVQQESDRSKQLSIEVDSAATTNTRTTLKSSQTADRDINLPDANDTLVGKSTTDTLTNKTINGDNNTIEDVSITSLKTELADAGKFIERDGSGAVVSGKDVPSGSVVGDSDTQTLTNKTINGTAATGTNIVLADAENVEFDNAASGLSATNTQSAIDEVDGRVDTIESNKLDGPGTHSDNILLKSDGVDTNDVQTTGIAVDDSNNITGVNDLTVGGDLIVQGTTTTLNSATLDVTDTNITVNKNGTDPSSEGAGLTIERAGTDGSFVYEDALVSKFKLGALGSEVEVVDVSSAQTMTNKDLSDSTNNIDTASADSLTRATGNQQVVTIPDTSTPDNFVLEAQQQTITNKDIDGGTASDTSRLTLAKADSSTLSSLTRKQGNVFFDTDLETIVIDDGVELKQISGQGGSGINYVPNPDGEVDVSGYNTYDDTNSVPTDGTGGSASSLVVTPVILAADVVRGQKSIGLVKSAANAQGEGASIDLDPIDNADKNQLLQISFDYSNIGVSPENYTNGDMGVYVYDVDNSTLLADSINTDGGDILFNENGKFLGRFYSTDSVNYRLIFHVKSTNALSYAISLDNVKVAPIDTFVPANALNETEVKPLTSNVTNLNTTLGAMTFTDLEIGAKYVVKGMFAANISSGADNLTLSVTHDGSVLAQPALSLGFTGAFSSTGFETDVFTATATTVTFVSASVGANTTILGNGTTGQSTWAALEKRNDLSSNVVSNNELSQRTVAAIVEGGSGSIPHNADTTIVFPTTVKDSHNIYNPANGEFTVPSTGIYSCESGVGYANNPSNVRLHRIYVNGSLQRTGDINSATAGGNPDSQTVSAVLFLQKGDIVTFRGYQNSGSSVTVLTGSDTTFASVVSIPDFTNYGVASPNAEYIEVQLSSNFQLASDSGPEDVPSMDFSLSPGRWEIGYTGTALVQKLSAAGQVWGQVFISDSSNVLVDNTASMMGRNNLSTSESMYGVLSNKTEIIITEETVYKLRAEMTDNGTSGSPLFRLLFDSLALMTNNVTGFKMWARRIS